MSFCGVLPTSALNGLSEGVHTLFVHACEVPNQPSSSFPGSCRWGDYNVATTDGTASWFEVEIGVSGTGWGTQITKDNFTQLVP